MDRSLRAACRLRSDPGPEACPAGLPCLGRSPGGDPGSRLRSPPPRVSIPHDLCEDPRPVLWRHWTGRHQASIGLRASSRCWPERRASTVFSRRSRGAQRPRRTEATRVRSERLLRTADGNRPGGGSQPNRAVLVALRLRLRQAKGNRKTGAWRTSKTAGTSNANGASRDSPSKNREMIDSGFREFLM